MNSPVSLHSLQPKIKVGPKCPTFIRGDPYEPHKSPQKVTFSYYQLGWFQVSESHKSFCLASISVRYEVPTQFLEPPAHQPHFQRVGANLPPPRVFEEPKKAGSNRVKCWFQKGCGFKRRHLLQTFQIHSSCLLHKSLFLKAYFSKVYSPKKYIFLTSLFLKSAFLQKCIS